ncbi:MAG TPA: hypothetical protein VHJ69_05905 [Gemmatimonadales bacterium]|jgi:hypothetical protein|nr:hypothetical protein [Gemmatimonadales bacterium]
MMDGWTDGRMNGVARRAARWNGLALLVAAHLPIGPSAHLCAQTSITVYNDGRVLVRRAVAAKVPKGASTHRLSVGKLDPSSIISLDPVIAIGEARYDADVGEQSVLRRAVGKTFEFQTGYQYGPLRATLLAVNPEVWRLPDSSIVFYRPGQLRYTEDMVVAEPVLELRVDAAQPKSALNLGFFTSGASWQAAYAVTLDGARARVEGLASIPVQEIRFDSAEVQLLAGTVSRGGPLRVGEMVVAGVAADRMEARMAAPTEQSVGEVHVYSLPGRWTLQPGTTSLIPLFEPATAPVTRQYAVRRPQFFYGIEREPEDPQQIPVSVEYTVARKRGSPFGDRPVPAGVTRIFDRDREGRLQLVGEAVVDHTPAGEDLELKAGNAFDVTARRKQTEFTTERDSSAAGVRIRATAAYEVALTNARDSAVTVAVYEQRGGEWTVLASSVPAEKVSATTTRFRVAVPARGSATLTYRIRAIW